MTTYYDNVNNNEKVKKTHRKFNDIQSDHLKNLFKNSNVILAQKQPKNLPHLLSKARFNTDFNNFIQLKGLCKCTDKRCKIYLLYVNEGNRFVMSKDMRWELRSHVKKRILEKWLAIMLLVLKAELISILVIVEQVLALVNFPYTHITVP